MRILLSLLIACVLLLPALPVAAQTAASTDCADTERPVVSTLPSGSTYTVCVPATATGGTTSGTSSVPSSSVTSGSGGSALDAQFVPLVGLPGVTDESGSRTLAGYLNALFRLAIGIGALIAVIKVIWGGIQYMSSDSFFTKAQGIKDVQNALLGLLIILSTVVVIRLINPDILNLNVLQGLEPIQPVVIDRSGDCPPAPENSRVITSCVSPEERREFLRNCAADGGILSAQPETGLPECVGGRVNTDASGEATLTRFTERYSDASIEQRRNFIQNVVNFVPTDADAVLAAWRASDPAYQDPSLEVVYIVEMSDDPSSLGTRINTQQAAICQDWNPSAGSGIIEDPLEYNGKRYQVCGFVQ